MERTDARDVGLMDTDRILRRIREVVGDAHLSTDPTGIAAYSRDTSLWSKTCVAVVHPASTDEVARVIRIAAEARLAVWPFSGGKNWGYGASMGFREGALILLANA
jgi:4-cresol dehydrogenase (hydroxylating)